MASSSGMKASSSRSMKTCSNEFCGKSMAVSRPGWKSGGREVDLCDQCFVAFCYNQFCSVYHKTLKGWKTCQSCQKEFHCGCFASFSSYNEINNEMECGGCVSQHANLNHSEETNDDTAITPSSRANGDTTITPTPCIHDYTITPTLHAYGDTTITPTYRDNGDTITPTPRAINDTTITPTPRVNDDINITPNSCPNDDIFITPIVPYHYIPRMTNLQFEKIKRGRVGENSWIVPLFEKVLTATDTGMSRWLVLPKNCAEKLLPSINDQESKQIVCQDSEGEDWKFTLKSLPQNKGYVLDEFYLYAQIMELSQGDAVTFSRFDPEGKLFIGNRKNSSESPSNNLPRAVIASTSSVRDTRGIDKSHNKSAVKAREKLAMVSKVTKGKPPSSASQDKAETSTRKRNSKRKNSLPTRANVCKGKADDSTSFPPIIVPFETPERAKGKHTKIGSKSHVANKKRKISAFDPTLLESTELEGLPRAQRSSKGKAVAKGSSPPPRKVLSKDKSVEKKIKNKTLRTIASSKRTKSINREPEPQAIVEARVGPEPSKVIKKHPRHRTECQCIICIQPPSGSKHSSTCQCRACVAKRLRIKNMIEKASQKPRIRRKRKVPEPTEPSKQQSIRVSHDSEEKQAKRREPSPSAEPSYQQTNTVHSGSEQNQNERTKPSQSTEPSNLQAIAVNCDSQENQNEQSLTGSHANNSIRPLFDLNLPPSDDDDFVDLTHHETNGYSGYISE